MPRVCSIIGCGESKENRKALFSMPKNKELHKKWIEVISKYLKPGRTNRKVISICEKHFINSDVEKQFHTILKDGTVNKIDRSVPKLAKGAVPKIFSMDDVDKNDVMKHSEISVEDHKEPVTNIKTLSSYRYKNLLKDIDDVGLPSHWTSITYPRKIMLHFSDINGVTTTVIITEEMKVTIRKLDCIMENEFAVTSYTDFKTYLANVENMQICEGINSRRERRHPSCFQLFTIERQPNTTRDMIRCSLCRQSRRNQRIMFRKGHRALLRKANATLGAKKMQLTINRLEAKTVSLENKIKNMRVEYSILSKQFAEEISMLMENPISAAGFQEALDDKLM